VSEQAFGRERCLALMSSVPVGRVVYTDRALPAVTPVNFVLDGDQVTIHTASGSTLAAAVRGAVVAFQVDDVDPVALTGWSVTVVGHARLVETAEEAERLPPLPGGQQYIQIATRQISGRPLSLAEHTGTETPVG
jgi:nitroimidazol reductase NimA-like FMN-containing flavoprotein (pyridoxamine 5'-phosphate oxidase superfamily)